MNANNIRRYAGSPLAFLEDLIIPSAQGFARFGDCMADFQRERFKQLVPALLAVARGQKPTIGRFWWEATKGASKDSDLACCLLWLLAFTARPLLCQVGAADADQAGELRKAAKDVLRLNPWLTTRVEILNWRIVCDATGASCEIIAADVAGSHGARPDVLICNELSHIQKQEFAENLLDNAAKVPQGLAVVATNAGFTGTWQYRWRELARTSERWCFNRWAQPSPWLDPKEIDEAKQRNSASRYQRLWHGVWASGAGDALDPDSIRAAITLTGPEKHPDPNVAYAIGLDLSTKRDRSALVLLAADWMNRRVRLAYAESWAPTFGGQVDLQAVQDRTLALAAHFGATVFFDPHQASLLVQQLAQQGVHCVEVPFVGQQLNRMASTLLQVFRERRIDLYEDSQLMDDLSRLMIVEKSWGYKLEAPSDESGHADLAFAFAIVLPPALDWAMTYDDSEQAGTSLNSIYDEEFASIFL